MVSTVGLSANGFGFRVEGLGITIEGVGVDGKTLH